MSKPLAALNLLADLCSDEIERRLDELEAEREALRILLRAARAKERKLRDIAADRPPAASGRSHSRGARPPPAA